MLCGEASFPWGAAELEDGGFTLLLLPFKRVVKNGEPRVLPRTAPAGQVGAVGRVVPGTFPIRASPPGTMFWAGQRGIG